MKRLLKTVVPVLALVFTSSVCAIAQDVTPTQVTVDIKPGSCKNPINFKSKGVVPVVILGSADFDVANINKDTIKLEGVAPKLAVTEDVVQPCDPATDEECCVSVAGEDTYPDLVLLFKTQSIAGVIGDVARGDVKTLTLTAELADGTQISGSDDAYVVQAPKQPKKPHKAPKPKKHPKN